MQCAFVASVYKYITFVSPFAIYVLKLKMLPQLSQFNAKNFTSHAVLLELVWQLQGTAKKMCNFICHILKVQRIIHVGLMVIF